MNSNDINAKLLFNNQVVLLPSRESESYYLLNAIRKANIKLLIVSHIEDDSHQVVQQEIFKRMLTRVPEQNSRVIYTNLKQIDSVQLKSLSITKHILLCGIELKNISYQVDENFTLDDLQILVTSNVEEIDKNASLKKTMWNEWMKQFGK